MHTQPFPAGVAIHPGHCAGVFCQGQPATVVTARVGPTWREAMALELCADCLADFAVAGNVIPPDVKVINVLFPDGQVRATEIPHLHVYAKGVDGLFHEVTGDIPAT